MISADVRQNVVKALSERELRQTEKNNFARMPLPGRVFARFRGELCTEEARKTTQKDTLMV
jgi:hypothetical protein